MPDWLLQLKANIGWQKLEQDRKAAQRCPQEECEFHGGRTTHSWIESFGVKAFHGDPETSDGKHGESEGFQVQSMGIAVANGAIA